MELELDDTGSDLLEEEKDQERYRSTRNGDQLMKVPFEFDCDLCHFRNMNKQYPVFRCKRDEDMFVVVRRAQLDVFWAKSLLLWQEISAA